MTKREKAIITIGGLYPTDSQWDDTNEIGQRLLKQAKENVYRYNYSWKNEPDEVLFEYARLCEIENDREMREAKRKAETL